MRGFPNTHTEPTFALSPRSCTPWGEPEEAVKPARRQVFSARNCSPDPGVWIQSPNQLQLGPLGPGSAFPCQVLGAD